MAKIMSMITTIPLLLLLGTCAVYWGIPLEYSLSATLDKFSYAIYGIGMILSWWFNRSRVFFTLIVIALAQFALSDLAAAAIAVPAYTKAIYPIVCLMLPVNICIFFMLKERGIFNGWGLGRFGIILFQAIYIAIAIVANDSTLLGFFYKEPPADTLPLAAVIPQSAVLAYDFVLLLILVKQLKQQSHLGNAFMAVLVATMLGLHLKAEMLALSVFFSVAGIIFILAVIQDSYSMAYLDELTGLPARRALKEELLKLSGEYTIAMVDIDFFKKFNDTYGHDTGDDVLRLVASVLQNVTGGGKAFRYGGEEFTIIFPHTKITEAIPHLEKLRTAVENCPYSYKSKNERAGKKKSPAKSVKQLFVTISIGVAERSEKHKNTSEVIKFADTALYRAKKKGRNCVSK